MVEDAALRAEQLLAAGLDRLGLSLDRRDCSRLVQYCLELRKWSAKVNLVARNTSLEDLVEKHFLDSLLLVPVLDELTAENPALLDVGSGAGFPGLVIKIARPEIRAVLLEPRQRRAGFLRHLVRTLRLEGIEVLAARTGDMRSGRDAFRVITGRAVADISRFLSMVAHIAMPGTVVICMQGEGGRQNVVAGETVAGFTCCAVQERVLPFSGVSRFILLFSPRPGQEGG